MRKHVKEVADFLGEAKELTSNSVELANATVLIFGDLVDDYIERAGITGAELRKAKRHAARGTRR